MNRFGFEEFGGPEVFEVIEAEQPAPKPGQVLIQVLGFGMNPYDRTLRTGAAAKSRPLPFPIVPGTDVMGRIVALGDEVHDFELGDIVMNYRPIGGYSEYVVASTSKIVKKPTALSYLDATALPQVGVAAYNILHYLLQAVPGKTIAIEGASGGVGAVLIQLAKFLKLNVIATASSKNETYLRQMGADEIGLYDQEDVGAKFADRADYVVNAINGGHDNGAGVQMIKADGHYVTVAYADVDLSSKPNVTHSQLGPDKSYSTKDALNFLVDVAIKWGLTVRVAASEPFTLAGVQAGQALLDTHHEAGKIVVMQDHKVIKPVRKDINHL
ncbi:NADP-dependent oxidoreductase [Lacticaseibacillus brantae]|uniref:NADPH quinone reductase related Zn-dependent oxidoreductase n=1 Tax=Lacticaseibacillus brantae DSM 23927 TaxID=1423727 RepID=A0A0R2B903_9LACO|nr:NADP-dependent oxidoreductase [Lacticaseibacillus brantae]KRM72873.1 NADPH quinone reductase related Zn-dependent oxidoreductase [Lacticaseibacillus brantae DSM 23927]